ncbi:MAG: CHAP domain-containing protein [Marmoricola sp.]
MSPLRRIVPFLAMSMSFGLLSLGAPVTAAASTGSGYLCTGYTACAKAGYSSSGYATAGSKMYWRMYGGHNCTNYVAYRMIQSGLPNTRPWSGSGNGSNWGAAMRSITNTSPAVGSVAWWPANAPGAGSAGHVAYVEKVVSSSEIIISEDMWGGDFHWRDILKSSTRWPKGFIHFNDAAVTNSALPRISGAPRVGIALTASPGAWTLAPSSYSYQWLANGTAISKATSSRYTPTADLVGKTLTVRVTAAKKLYRSGSATSSATARVKPGAMTSTAAPAISGTPSLGETLTASKGAWSPAATAQTVQWYADGKPIAGAAGWTLVLGDKQVGTSVTAVAKATRSGYVTPQATAAAVGPVTAGRITVEKPFALTGANQIGKTLTVGPGSFTPTDATATYQWLRGSSTVPGATTPTHTLTSADLGSHMSVRITIGSPHYLPSTSVVRTPGVTTTRPTLTLSSVGKSKHAVVSVRVRAPGVAGPTGRVTVKVGLRSRTVQVVNGRAKADVEGLTHGVRQVRVYYLGTSTIVPTMTRGTVRLP